MGVVSFSVLSIGRRFCSTNSIQNPIMKYLNVAEKNDAAKNIAAILARGAARRRDSFSVYNKIYEFDATVLGEQVQMVMTSVSGHLLNYEFATNFRNWKSCNPVALFDAPIVKSCSDNFKNIKKTLEMEIRSCQGLIIWTDCDREGENIGFEIIKVCSDVKPNLRIYRAKFSEITGASIFRALNTLGQPNKNVSDAVDVRQELDLRTGAAFTRLQTLRLCQVFPQKLADRLISYGSCQFPTLGFVVERYQSIENFIPEPFWKIKMNHKVKDLTTEFTWKRDRLFDKNSCEAILDICKESPTARIEKIESKPKSKWRPVPLDTVEMEKTVSRKLKITAKDTMKIAERLYSQGYISYPRTETNIFPKELNLTNLVVDQQNDQRWGAFAQRIMAEGGPNPRQGKKSDQAHPPIHPTKYTNALQGDEQRVYEYIVRHFLACVQKDAQGFETIVTADIAGEKFTAKGLIILEKNYLEVYVYEKWNAKEVNNYEENETFTPTVLEMNEGETSAPKLLTEADLIALMDKHGIGTDATHAEHIDTIKSREYVGLHENIYFVPGTLGMGLVEGYNNIGLEVSLAKPILRSEFENDLKLICDGVKNHEDVRREQIAKYKAVFQTVVEKMTEIDQTLALRLSDTPQAVQPEQFENFQSRTVLKCPKCGQDMTVKDRKNGQGMYLGCCGFPECKNAVWLPQCIEKIDVLEESCETCGPSVKMIRVKFKQNIFPGEPNPNVLCIGGCDETVLETLNISLSSVSNRNRVNGNNSVAAAAGPPPRAQNLDQTWRNTTVPATSQTRPALGNMAPVNNNHNRNAGNNASWNGGNTDEEIVCSCNVAALQLTVRKDGPNKGRKFYKCASQVCNFFLWVSDNAPVAGPSSQGSSYCNRMNNNNASVSVNDNNEVKCNCNVAASRKTVFKDGPNKGRPFYCCHKPQGQGCSFFKWGDEDDNGGGGNDHFGGGGGGGGGGGRNGNFRGRGGGGRGAASSNSNKPRSKRKCSKCGVEGHTKNKCPN